MMAKAHDVTRQAWLEILSYSATQGLNHFKIHVYFPPTINIFLLLPFSRLQGALLVFVIVKFILVRVSLGVYWCLELNLIVAVFFFFSHLWICELFSMKVKHQNTVFARGYFFNGSKWSLDFTWPSLTFYCEFMVITKTLKGIAAFLMMTIDSKLQKLKIFLVLILSLCSSDFKQYIFSGLYVWILPTFHIWLRCLRLSL